MLSSIYISTLFALGLLNNSKSTHLLLGVNRSVAQKNIELTNNKHLLKFWTFTVSLTLNSVIHSFHKTFWLIVMYHQTARRRKSISSSEDTAVIFHYYKSSHCDLDLEDTNVIFSRETPNQYVTSSYQVRFHWKIQRSRRYPSGKYRLQSLTFTLTLTLATAIQEFHDTLRFMTIKMDQQTKFSVQKNSSSEIAIETALFRSFIRWALSVAWTLTLTLTIAPNCFTRHSSSWWCTAVPRLVTKGWAA